MSPTQSPLASQQWQTLHCPRRREYGHGHRPNSGRTGAVETVVGAVDDAGEVVETFVDAIEDITDMFDMDGGVVVNFALAWAGSAAMTVPRLPESRTEAPIHTSAIPTPTAHALETIAVVLHGLPTIRMVILRSSVLDRPGTLTRIRL